MAGFVAAGVVVVQTTRIGADAGPSNETAFALKETGDDNNESTDLVPTQAPEPPPPANWYCTDFDAYVGKQWQDLALFRWCSIRPDESTTHIVLYSRNCDHCEEMFHFDFAGRDDLTSGILAVEVPDADAEVAADGSWFGTSEWPCPRPPALSSASHWDQLDHHRPIGGWTGQWHHYLHQRGGPHPLYGFGMIDPSAQSAFYLWRRQESPSEPMDGSRHCGALGWQSDFGFLSDWKRILAAAPRQQQHHRGAQTMADTLRLRHVQNEALRGSSRWISASRHVAGRWLRRRRSRRIPPTLELFKVAGVRWRPSGSKKLERPPSAQTIHGSVHPLADLEAM